jgi:phosphate acyltransferase
MRSSEGIRIVVDAMGGDFAPRVNVDGALSALEADGSLHLILVGPTALLEAELKVRKAAPGPRLSLIHADESISMDDPAASSIRKKKGSSIHVGLTLVKEGKAEAFVSAGNSGAIMAGAALLLGRLPQVERPAIVLRIPTAEGYVVILDGGANVDCKPSHLVQFAEMGSAYAEIVEGLEKPKVALLSNGSETHKGNELTRETHAVLEKHGGVNYIGYVEGYDLFRGTADVIVCDGFVGNVLLKVCEGLAESTFRWFRTEVKRNARGLLGIALLRPLLQRFRDKFDYQPYGAAPLLGIKGMVLISHGSSTEVAIRNGILTAKRGVERDFLAQISGRIGTTAHASTDIERPKEGNQG